MTRRNDIIAALAGMTLGALLNLVSTKPLPPPVARGLEVRYGDRVVRFTPEEIMDALEVIHRPRRRIRGEREHE